MGWEVEGQQRLHPERDPHLAGLSERDGAEIGGGGQIVEGD